MVDDHLPHEPLRGRTKGRSATVGEVLDDALPAVEATAGAAGDEESEEELVAKHLAEQREQLTRRRLAVSDIPARWHGAAWEELDRDETPARAAAVAAAIGWSVGEGEPGLLLTGPVGIGKTRIVATAAAHRIRHGLAVRWLSVAELLMDLSRPFSSPERERAMKRLEARGAGLVLDDLDKLKPTEHAIQPIYVAVNGWVDAGLPLAVTMNRDLESLAADFGDRYGDPIASRLAEHCEVVELSGRDRRIEP